MTGVITAVDLSAGSGLITAENGSKVVFDTGAVMAYDRNILAVGQMVAFQTSGRDGNHAIDVSIEARPHYPAAADSVHEALRFRYVGFDQSGSTRAYRFERRSPGEQTQILVVRASLPLLLLHHIKLQEGPGLCLGVLLHEMGPDAGLPRDRCLTEQNVLDHLANLPQPTPKQRAKRAPQSPVANSYIHVNSGH